MSTEPSKYAENQFESATRESNPLMSELLDTTVPRITAAAAINIALIPARDAIIDVAADWNTGETAATNTLAAQRGATLTFTDTMASLTRKPNIETNSTLESWDLTIRSVAPAGGSTYTVLLPQGRETVTTGTYAQQLDALRDFGIPPQPASRSSPSACSRRHRHELV